MKIKKDGVEQAPSFESKTNADKQVPIQGLELSNSSPILTALVDSNGDQIVSFGGGTQYTEDAAAAAANPVGTAQILVRQDTPASEVTTDGDNIARRATAYGAAYSQIVDSSGNFIDTFGGGTQYAVDGALGATPTGTLSLAKRDDALSALTPVEGDAVELRVDANGALWTIINGTVTVDGSGVTQPISAASLPLPTGASTLSEQQSQTTHLATIAGDTTSLDGKDFATETTLASALTSLQLIDDAVYVDDSAFTAGTDKGMMIMGFAGPQSVDSGDAAALACTTGGVLHVNIQGDTLQGLEVIQATAADLNMTEANSAAILADTANMDTNLGTIAGAVSGTEMQVDVLTSALPTGAATNAAQLADGHNVTAIGAAAHDAAVSGNPVLQGLEARTTTPTAVADGDAVRAMADTEGRQVNILNAPRDLTVHQTTTIASSTSETTILTAGAAGVLHDIVTLWIFNEGGQAETVTIKDDTGGTTRFIARVPSNGGMVAPLAVPLTQAVAADNWTATCTNGNANIFIFVQAVKNS